MFRKLSVFALLIGFVLTSQVRADDEKKPRRPNIGNRDPEAIFKKLDIDNDGKLSKDEFKKVIELLAQRAEKLKDNPQLIDKLVDRLFDKLDTNSDGKISKDEFKKLSELRGQFGKGKNDK